MVRIGTESDNGSGPMGDAKTIFPQVHHRKIILGSGGSPKYKNDKL